MKKRPAILLWGTDPITLSQLHIGLETAGYVAQTTQQLVASSSPENSSSSVETLSEVLAWLKRSPPALIVVDGQSDNPAYDPWLVGRRLREATTCPIVMLLPEGSRSRCVEALRLGMDDCLARPFHLQELITRIRQILWRLTETNSQRRAFPHLTMDPISQTVTVNAKVVHLTPTEFRLLYALFLHAGEPLSHEYLLKAVWGHADPSLRNRLKLFIWQLRQKLEIDPRVPQLIVTEQEPGGYSLRVTE